jgi:uncharacterized protein (TIGR02996 family)
MNLRDGFVKALAENEDDTTTRLVFADWLDEQGEHEEADRQRKWPAAKEWLMRFCKENSEYQEVSYAELINFGRRVATATSDVDVSNYSLWSALHAKTEPFFLNWSVVTGMALPPNFQAKGFHSWQCCPNENYYWFGAPGPSEDEDE